MNSYKDMYYHLFNKITDMIHELEAVQKQAEEMCISEEPGAKVLPIYCE